MWLGSRQEDEGKEGGESSIEHGGANLCQGIPDPLIPWALVGQEGVCYVDGVVDTQPDGDDDVGAGHRVDGQAPEVDEAPTLTRVSTTQPSTSREAVRLNSSNQVVANTQTVASRMLRYSSSEITCNGNEFYNI